MRLSRTAALWVFILLMGENTSYQAQADLDSLDAWVRTMHPAPFLRCGEQAWVEMLDDTREMWLDANHLERIRATNRLLQVLQDSHSSVSPWHWVFDVEREYGSIPIQWAIEGRALWVQASADSPGIDGTRVLALNGIPAEACIEAALDLACMEGPSVTATSRNAAHLVTAWVLGTTQRDTLTLTLVGPAGLPHDIHLATQGWWKSAQGWAQLSPRQPVVDWTFPDGSGLTRRDTRRTTLRTASLHPGAATLKITSFASGPWFRYGNRLRKGFSVLQQLNCPLVIDLRGNLGGMSTRMELLWKSIALERRALPFALVAKQSTSTLKAQRKGYRGLRKRWVDKHLADSPEAQYVHRMVHLPLGSVDTLTFPVHYVLGSTVFRGPVCVLMDGESASATVSFAGAFQDTKRGPIMGEPCMGPSVGTMGNPYLKTLPRSGIVVSLATAVFMAQPCEAWSTTTPIQPDILLPSLWNQPKLLEESLARWIEEAQRP
ncbi:MAG: S41 family peptidase [Bacteroidetes bacterium]|nr:S41 family peptidase [Bacteroidota bacterium]MDA1241789.1 S41 family peptidase [Bacteroidota bacterium]